MRRTPFNLHFGPLIALLALSVGMVSTAAARPLPQGENDITRQELGRFDRFLDNHPEIAEQLKKDPSLINNEDFLEKRPELREFLKNHPRVREELKENPRAFMNRERGFEERERDRRKGDNDITRGELAKFDQFLDRHPGIDTQLRKDPSLVNNEDFLEKHPELREFLKNHPAVRDELKENPRAFMRRERRFERRERKVERREHRGNL